MVRIGIVFFLLCCSVQSQNMKMMTYNIRLDNPDDGVNRWDLRKSRVTDLIRFYEPDVFGIQEGLPHQVAFMDSVLVGYDYVGKGRDGFEKGEYSAIFFSKEKYELLETQTFWLSETPDTISKGWDAALNRISSYCLLRCLKTNRKFYVFNTHFDHIGEKARMESAKLIQQKVTEINKENLPVVVMGDLNSTPESDVVRYLSEHFTNVKTFAVFIYNATGTFNAFDFQTPVTTEIDYIFTAKFRIKTYAVLTDSFECKYPSDHFPVLAEISWK